MKLPNFGSPSSRSSPKSANFGLSKWIFYVKNHPNLSKKKFIEEYQFRRTFFVKSIFSLLQFLNHFITKMTPNFLTNCHRMEPNGDPKFGNFIWLQLILGQKPCFLWPIQLVRRKVNIHYLKVYWVCKYVDKKHYSCQIVTSLMSETLGFLSYFGSKYVFPCSINSPTILFAQIMFL